MTVSREFMSFDELLHFNIFILELMKLKDDVKKNTLKFEFK